MAPAYANLFMGKLETKLMGIGKPYINLWKRYVDDIFIIWTGNTNSLTTYIHKINSIHPTIKFTFEYSNTELTFLDTTLYKGPQFPVNGSLDVKTHIKPTNKQIYIHQTSYHPDSCKKGIAKGETQ